MWLNLPTRSTAFELDRLHRILGVLSSPGYDVIVIGLQEAYFVIPPEEKEIVKRWVKKNVKKKSK